MGKRVEVANLLRQPGYTFAPNDTHLHPAAINAFDTGRIWRCWLRGRGGDCRYTTRRFGGPGIRAALHICTFKTQRTWYREYDRG